MATITGLTAYRMLQIENQSIVDGEIVNDNLILSRFDGNTINAGNVRGPEGPQGGTLTIKGSVSLITNLPTSGNSTNDAYIVDENSHIYVWNGTTWIDAGTMQGPAGIGIPSGGISGQILVKDTTTDYDTSWADNVTPAVKYLVKNTTGTIATAGTVIYITGSDGTNITFSRADADTEITSSKTVGLIETDIAINGTGYVVTEGLLSGLNTATATVGQSVWLSSTVGGFVFNAPPAKPAHSVYLGVVTRSNANNGEIFVKVQNGYEINELHDVNASTPSNGDILKWDSTTSMWISSTLAASNIPASLSSTTSVNGTTIPSSATLLTSTSTTVPTAVTATSASQFGFMGLPQVIATGNLSLTAVHAGKHIYTTTTGLTHTIPASTTALEIGTTFVFINPGAVSTSIAINTDTLYLAGTGTTGTRTLAAYGMATAVKVTATSWVISGNGLT